MQSDEHSIDLQERDLALLKDLFESRVMTLKHVAALHFGGSTDAAKKRLQKLNAAGFIAARRPRRYEPALLSLTQKAFGLLEERGMLASYPRLAPTNLEKRARVSELTLKHELEVMDVKAAVTVAVAETQPFRVAEFCTWPLLNEFEARRPGYTAPVLVKPDGFIRVHELENDVPLYEHTFFLELDRSTETQDTLALRAACYADYYRSGGFAVRNGQPPAAFKEFPFRVLMVFQNEERRNNAAERMLQLNPPIYTLVWLTTLDEVLKQPLAPIWIRPADYRDATKDSPFDPLRQQAHGAYVRRPEREVSIARRIRKHPLLTDGTAGD